MSKFIITGGRALSGEIAVKGAKNAALKLFPASLILDGPVELSNVPDIEDVRRKVEIMRALGIEIQANGDTYRIESTKVNTNQLHPQLHQKVRTSILLAGPMLLQTGEVNFPYPGGCVIGKRPIDYFISGFRQFGIKVEERDDGFKLVGKKLKPARIVFPRVSVTGTEAMMTLASKIPGESILINAAMEPEIPALAEFLNSCGANIQGAGTPTITINGVDSLSGGSARIIPDRIEAGSLAILGLATGSQIKVSHMNPQHLEVLWQLLSEADADFTLGDDFVEVRPSKNLTAIPKDIVTHEYPGLATDLQSPLVVLMTQSTGRSLVFETIYEGRLFFVDALNNMGADILMCDPHRVLVEGPTKLYGKKLASPDIRAGLALVIAGLCAKGVTEIDNIYQIDRGYEKIDERLHKLGAQIERI